ncbi:class I SAM-dependent methyltransferase [Candidatus Saccharibacteria bacterium]|nr:class I SAM-dependent methyltransferase [Candidatus Saccharibacteria bacterium]
MIIIALLSIIVLLLFFIFSFVILFGAPYVPTLSSQRKNALDILDLKPGQTLYELGSGDGTLILEAAKRGYKVVGYELNPILVLLSRYRTRKFKSQVRIIWGNFWKADISKADAVFVFLLDHYMKKLDEKIKAEHKKGTLKLASHAFTISGKKPDKKLGAVYRYTY